MKAYRSWTQVNVRESCMSRGSKVASLLIRGIQSYRPSFRQVQLKPPDLRQSSDEDLYLRKGYL